VSRRPDQGDRGYHCAPGLTTLQRRAGPLPPWWRLVPHAFVPVTVLGILFVKAGLTVVQPGAGEPQVKCPFAAIWRIRSSIRGRARKARR
jgi:hypothetical protein